MNIHGYTDEDGHVLFDALNEACCEYKKKLREWRRFLVIKKQLGDVNIDRCEKYKASGRLTKDSHVGELRLSVRTSNSLNNANVSTIGEILNKTHAEMLKHRNVGIVTITEITVALAVNGFTWK